MNLTTTLKQHAPPDSTRFVARYLNELIDYGGQPYTRAEVILHLQSIGATQPMIDRWLQGYEHRQRTLHRRTPVQSPSPSSPRKSVTPDHPRRNRIKTLQPPTRQTKNLTK